MSTPLSKEDEAIAMFDSFCKTVIMNNARRYWRRALARNAHIRLVPDIDSIASTTQEMDVVETYTILYGTVRADFQCLTLYRAAHCLKADEKAVILLKFWGGYTDMEISAWLRVTDRTVRNLKKRAYQHISATLTKED